MSALAARRAAQTAQSSSSSPAPVRAAAATRTGTRAASVSSASSQSAESEASGEESEAGPSTSSTPAHRAKKLRYYAAPAEVLEPGDSSSSAAPSRKAKRKRAYSPGAPVDSDGSEDSSAAGDEGEEETGMEDAPYGSTMTTPRPAGQESGQLATTNFSPRRGVNVELLSMAALAKAGLQNISGSGLIVSLAPNENISLAGVFHLVPLQRPIDIFSSTLSPSPDPQARHAVFAPISHPIPNISHATAPARAQSPLIARLPLPAAFDIASSRAVFLILEQHTGIEGMRGGAVPGFNTIWGDEKGWLGLRGVHAIPGSILSTCYPYTTPSSWSTALDSLISRGQANGHTHHASAADEAEDCPIVLVKGPKRSGKSTLARAALNTLLGDFARVAWLECDLGQGEIGCGGVIGLWVIDQPVFGPPFTHPCQANRAHFLGTYTPLTCPDEYLAAIDHLIQHYRYELQYPPSSSTPKSSGRCTDTIPLVINTQGWVKGLGEELLRALEGFAQATHIFAFDTAADESLERPGWTSSPTLPPVPLPPTSTGRPPQVYTVEPAQSTALQARYTAIDHRTLSTLSYFHSSLPPPLSPSSVSWDFSAPLIARTPYEVVLGDAVKAVYIIGEGSDGVLPEDLPLALNGSLIALVEVDNLDPEHPVYTQNRPLPSLDEVNFLGFGIVRAISPSVAADHRGSKIHLLTPLSAETLGRVNAIVKNGAMELPTAGMLDWRDRGEEGAGGVLGVPWGEVPFFDTGAGGVGVERRRWRRNLMRKGM
ncbi:uncharacterized protein MKK02DRAFT_34344 [Dioszegia hungarica]|uniref:Polynucleotide 5'-hydroxyl-kinase GRC3 n=1 Tax=Dioszegia hungarica TaxID=4972 RepID=A0AA38H9G4_9TREE|nr:uncharacterized protein MKK02DRAFT_34344 [Dioszegia hungarica]KAI9634884.1 hypothetical protein MKK02DRAFT_34344 [Dioszegia hungarica]